VRAIGAPLAHAVTWELNVQKASQAELVAATAIQGLANRDGHRCFFRPVTAIS